MNDDQSISEEELLDEDSDLTGESSLSGSSPSTTSDDDTAEALEDVIGNEPVPGEPFSLADEIEKDELERRGIDPKDMGIE